LKADAGVFRMRNRIRNPCIFVVKRNDRCLIAQVAMVTRQTVAPVGVVIRQFVNKPWATAGTISTVVLVTSSQFYSAVAAAVVDQSAIHPDIHTVTAVVSYQVNTRSIVGAWPSQL